MKRRHVDSGGPPQREERFLTVAAALSQARSRNLPVECGGPACPVLVEGKKDVRALKRLGFIGPIECLNRGWPRERVVTYLYENYGLVNPVDGGPAIIMLMDWDRTGGRIQREMSTRLRALDVLVDEATRTDLIRGMKPEGRTVESLAPFATQLRILMRSFNDDCWGEEE